MRAPNWPAPTSWKFCFSRSERIRLTGRRETFGINVFKVREVMRTPPITRRRNAGIGGGNGQLRGVLVSGRRSGVMQASQPMRRVRS